MKLINDAHVTFIHNTFSSIFLYGHAFASFPLFLYLHIEINRFKTFCVDSNWYFVYLANFVRFDSFRFGSILFYFLHSLWVDQKQRVFSLFLHCSVVLTLNFVGSMRWHVFCQRQLNLIGWKHLHRNGCLILIFQVKHASTKTLLPAIIQTMHF